MNKKNIAYLGPPGTNTEQAALKSDSQAHLIPFPSVAAVASAVDTGIAAEGIVPIENSLEGSVPDTLDLLIHESQLLICRELVLNIENHLLVKQGTSPSGLKVIFSHPQALGQCRRFLERCYPKAQMVAALSTAAAVEEMMASKESAAAVGNSRAAELYGAQILARNIQDRSPNVTRFVVLAANDHSPTGRDKTSLAFTFADDRPGLLYEVLGEFAKHSINLDKIESRPSKEALGRYVFLIDLEGHRQDKLIVSVLEQVQAKTSFFKIMGSYPKYQAAS